MGESNEKKSRLRQILVQIFCTKIGWLLISLLSAFIFGIIADRTDCEWCSYVMYASFVYPVILTLIMIVYAWFINPIRDWKENKKLREQNKNKDGK